MTAHTTIQSHQTEDSWAEPKWAVSAGISAAIVPHFRSPVAFAVSQPRFGRSVSASKNSVPRGRDFHGPVLLLAACQKGFSVAFTTAAGLVHQLMEARDERRLLKLQRDLAAVSC